MTKEIIRKYTNGELTIVWKPSLCTHAGVCTRTLPEVYNTQERPWIKAGNASTKALKAQRRHCPSKALSYYMNEED